MSGLRQEPSTLEQLLQLHAVDQQIMEAERELQRRQEELSTLMEDVAGQESRFEQLEAEIVRVRADERASERLVDEKRETLDRLRSRVNQVKNEKQYGAATLEFDLVKQELRSLEDKALAKLQAIEELEGRRNGLRAELDVVRAEVGPLAEEVDAIRAKLEDELAISRDRRDNLAIRIEDGVLVLYDRIRAGRSAVAVAPLTDEGVCGNCFTSVTIQQEMQIKGMSVLVCCEGCGVILYREEDKP